MVEESHERMPAEPGPACLRFDPNRSISAVIQVWLTNIKYNAVNWSSGPPDRYLSSDFRRIAFAFAFAMSGIRGLKANGRRKK